MSTSFGSILQKALMSAFVESEGLTTLIASCIASTSAFLLAYDIRYVAYVVEVEVEILDEALGIDREVVSRFRIGEVVSRFRIPSEAEIHFDNESICNDDGKRIKDRPHSKVNISTNRTINPHTHDESRQKY